MKLSNALHDDQYSLSFFLFLLYLRHDGQMDGCLCCVPRRGAVPCRVDDGEKQGKQASQSRKKTISPSIGQRLMILLFGDLVYLIVTCVRGGCLVSEYRAGKHRAMLCCLFVCLSCLSVVSRLAAAIGLEINWGEGWDGMGWDGTNQQQEVGRSGRGAPSVLIGACITPSVYVARRVDTPFPLKLRREREREVLAVF